MSACRRCRSRRARRCVLWRTIPVPQMCRSRRARHRCSAGSAPSQNRAARRLRGACSRHGWLAASPGWPGSGDSGEAREKQAFSFAVMIRRAMTLMRTRPVVALIIAGCVIALARAGAAEAAVIKVLTGFGLKPVLEEVGPAFEQATGHKLVIQYGSSASSKRQIEAGDSFDVVILTSPAAMDELVRHGTVVAASRATIARSGIGVAVRAGAQKPAIDSVDAFRRALLHAKSVAFDPEGAIGRHMTTLFDRLNITIEMKTKTRPQLGAERVLASVILGEAQLGFAVSSAILATPEAELVGLLPRELQDYVVYNAGVGADSKDSRAAKALISFLTGDSSAAVMRAKGLERMAP